MLKRRSSAEAARMHSFVGPICCPRALARLLPSAVRVRMRPRSTSAKPPRTVIISRPVLVLVSAHGSAKDRNCALASTMDLEQIEGAASEAVNPRHRHHVTRGQLVEHPVEFAPVGPRARYLLAVDVAAAASGGAHLRKLAVDGLPHGADADIADEPFFGVSFDHILRER